MNLIAYLTLWWTALTLVGCLALNVAHPNDHSLLSGLLGVLFLSFFLYGTLRLVLAIVKQRKTRGRIPKM